VARLFISHSSANDAEAVAIRDWLAAEGWDDVFLDLDPERGIKAGERWERALNEAASRCEAVLFLVSHAWLDSTRAGACANSTSRAGSTSGCSPPSSRRCRSANCPRI
jgi:hypothetical protein